MFQLDWLTMYRIAGRVCTSCLMAQALCDTQLSTMAAMLVWAAAKEARVPVRRGARHHVELGDILTDAQLGTAWPRCA